MCVGGNCKRETRNRFAIICRSEREPAITSTSASNEWKQKKKARSTTTRTNKSEQMMNKIFCNYWTWTKCLRLTFFSCFVALFCDGQTQLFLHWQIVCVVSLVEKKKKKKRMNQWNGKKYFTNGIEKFKVFNTIIIGMACLMPCHWNYDCRPFGIGPTWLIITWRRDNNVQHHQDSLWFWWNVEQRHKKNVTLEKINAYKLRHQLNKHTIPLHSS